MRAPGFYLAALSRVLDVPLAVLEDPMLRREFLTDVAGTAIAPVVASDLLAKGFAARLASGPTVEAWEAKLAAYGTAYMSMGAADIQRRVAGELVVVQQQLDQPRLWSVAARLMTLYAKTFPGSYGAAAVRWLRSTGFVTAPGNDKRNPVSVQQGQALLSCQRAHRLWHATPAEVGGSTPAGMPASAVCRIPPAVARLWQGWTCCDLDAVSSRGLVGWRGP
ncbi:hypothetical protein ACFCYH_18610 [Streptomyces sp. NPDC056400]|uniref:hypothetical protein n=1 Tax=Streptomyces sp. NPDC056400 TaxID=3345808 RepID=UPI0035DB6B98